MSVAKQMLFDEMSMICSECGNETDIPWQSCSSCRGPGDEEETEGDPETDPEDDEVESDPDPEPEVAETDEVVPNFEDEPSTK